MPGARWAFRPCRAARRSRSMRLSPFGASDRLLVSPPERRRVEPLLPLPFAHRGLHGPGVVENSRSAFQAAIARGHGIELDVQASADHEAIVFHDYDLGRLTEEDRKSVV